MPRWRLINNSAFHHETDAPQGQYVVRRVAFDGDQVGQQSRLHQPDLILHVEDARVNGRGGAQRIYQGHAEVHHRFDLASVVAVSVNAYVAAARDGHALPEGCLEDLALVRGVRAGDGE